MRDMWCPRGWMDTCISGGRPGVRQDATARAACREHTANHPASTATPADRHNPLSLLAPSFWASNGAVTCVACNTAGLLLLGNHHSTAQHSTALQGCGQEGDLDSGHAGFGLAGGQARVGQAQLALVHGLLDQGHVDLRHVLAHLQPPPMLITSRVLRHPVSAHTLKFSSAPVSPIIWGSHPSSRSSSLAAHLVVFSLRWHGAHALGTASIRCNV